MINFTISGFWQNRFKSIPRPTLSNIRGWSGDVQPLQTFKEAPLGIGRSFGDGTSPETSDLLLISAPGAVGKSTLARQISSQTNAIYIDLAEAEPVGSNTLSGGLVKSGAYQAWIAGQAAVLIDGLDEARLKVTQEAFEAFLNDVADIARNRNLPTVLFGRTGAVQDAWLILSDRLTVSVLEIGYYGASDALEFAVSLLQHTYPSRQHPEINRRALDLLLGRLRADTEGDGDRFAGYAPVIQAIANRVASESNPSALIAQIEKGEQPVTLTTVVGAILVREQQKLSKLTFEDSQLSHSLYAPKEQLERLASTIYKQSMPNLPKMSANDAQTYMNALATWVPEHPFLDGNARPASTVFHASIAAVALNTKLTNNAALSSELKMGSAANPFLAEFYLSLKNGGELPPEHIGVIYSSLRSRLSLGDTASLSIDGAEDGDEEEQLLSEVEIMVTRFDDEKTSILRFQSEQAGTIRLGSHIEDVEVNAPFATVEVGGAKESIFISPVSIQCDAISFSTERIIIDCQKDNESNAVYLEANIAHTENINTVPAINSGAKFSICWPGAKNYPWTNFSSDPVKIADPRVEEALRRFRKFIISFRSHSKGSLKRLAAKLEHARMTKGSGRAVLDLLLARHVITRDGKMLMLHQDLLSREADVSYQTCMERRFPERAIEFVTTAISKSTK